MNWIDIVTYVPFAAGALVGAGLFLLIALLAVIAFFWSNEE
jgi:hypothetical protein